MPDNEFIEPSAPDFGAPFRALLDHCKNRGLKFRAGLRKKRIKLTLCRRHALYSVNLHITHSDSVFQIHVIYPVLAKDKRMRPAAADFFARANFGLVIGNFELDMRDGEVRFHIGHLIADENLDDDTIQHLISSALSTADRYFPSYMQLLFGGTTAEDAVFLAELDMHSAQVKDSPSAQTKPAASGKTEEKPEKPTKPAAKKRTPRSKTPPEPATPEGPGAPPQETPTDETKPAGDNPSGAAEED